MPKFAMLLAALLSPFAVHAGDSDSRRWFDLPAQTLERALQAYGQLTGLAVLVDAPTLAGLRSTAVRGRFSDDDALRRMLAGTGLAPRFVGDDAFTLVMVPVDSPMPAPPVNEGPRRGDDRSRQRAARMLQRGLEDALCADPLTRPGGYRAMIRFRVDARGRIGEAELQASSGDALRDRAILARVAGRSLPGLPEDLPQPITLTLLPETADSTPPCAGGGR